MFTSGYAAQDTAQKPLESIFTTDRPGIGDTGYLVPPGIWHIRNLIKARSTEGHNDEGLEQRVQKAFKQNPMVDRYDIKISSRNGIVFLEDYLRSPTEISQAIRTAARLKGVTGIMNYPQIESFSNEQGDEEIWEEISRSFW